MKNSRSREGDNPTVGLILCFNNDKTVMEYSMLKESKQLFDSKYQLYSQHKKRFLNC